jgi:hypothetical protein
VSVSSTEAVVDATVNLWNEQVRMLGGQSAGTYTQSMVSGNTEATVQATLVEDASGTWQVASFDEEPVTAP